MLTVGLRDLLGELDVTVRGGALDVQVRWVHITEHVDVSRWLDGGEMVLTTGQVLDTQERQRAFVGNLAGAGATAIGFGLGVYHDTVPQPLLEAAERASLPVVEIPYATPFIAITRRASELLINQQYALMRRSITVQERLQRIVLAEQGLAAVMVPLASFAGATVIVLDGRGTVLAQHPEDTIDADDLTALAGEIRGRTERGEARSFVPTLAGLEAHTLALAVPTSHGGGLPRAWLAAIKRNEPLSEIQRLVLHQAVTVVALEMLRCRVAATTERRLAGDVLAQMVDRRLLGGELARRLEPFGLGKRVAALVLELTDQSGGPCGAGTIALCEQALSSALGDESVAALVATEHGRVCALIPGYDDDDLFTVAARVVERVAGQFDSASKLYAGVGRAVDCGEGRRAYHEARCAMESARIGGGPDRVLANGRLATYRDLGSFELLLALQETQALSLYCDSLLGPIERGEGHYGGELMRSLEAFIECNGQWEAAAKRLFCHRHTLRYRIRKIQELTGRDLGNARDRIEFWLALRGRDIAGDDVMGGELTALP